MFDKVLAPELIPSILEKFIRVYMREHGLQEEELLLLYIEVTSLDLVFFPCLCAMCHYIKHLTFKKCHTLPLGFMQHVVLARLCGITATD